VEANVSIRQGWTRTAIIAAAGLFAGLLSVYPALAQVDAPDGPIACRDFARNGYGDWRVLRPTTISPKGMMGGMPMRLAPGETFMPSELVHGVEITAVLDRNCGNM
jgi:hypothetical protein